MVLAAVATAAPPIVSTQWLQEHLNDPLVRIICVGQRGEHERGHIPGARLVELMQTTATGGGLAPVDALVRTFITAGVTDGAQVVLLGDTPMATGWVYMALASIGHGDDVSWLDGNMNLWRTEKRPVSTSLTEPGTGPLTARPGGDAIVDSAWVQSRLESTTAKILDVRSEQEWQDGHLPNATLILWGDLFQDRETQKFKSPDDIRALLTRAGVQPDQEVITLLCRRSACQLDVLGGAIGRRSRPVYLGSWRDWSSNPSNPIVR